MSTSRKGTNGEGGQGGRHLLERLEPRVLLSGVPGVELYADEALTVPGLTGSYVDRTLSDVTGSDDWRITQAIAGTRVDDPVEFLTDGWGSRAEVGLTGGSDDNWESFSVQWDGYVQVSGGAQRLATVSDDASRIWIDLDRDGVFEQEELADNNWGGFQGAAMKDRTAGIPAGTYPVRIQYYEGGGGNTFELVGSPWMPEPFVPAPDDPQQVIKAIVLNFSPRVPSEGNKLMHEVFDSWSDPRYLAAEFEADLEWASGGAVDFQVFEWRDLDAFPVFTDGFRYNPDEYVANRRAGSGWHDAGTDFYHLVESQGLHPLINAGDVDEIWTFGDHYFDILGEAWMGGPNSFFINGPSFSDAGFDRATAGYGFSYEHGIAEMIHNLCHRTENHGQRAFGPWDLDTPQTAFDKFSANYHDTASGPYGIGSCHIPANADGHYDYGDPRTVDSYAFDFANYPDMTWGTQPVSRETWAMGSAPNYHRDFMNWYYGMMPRNGGTDADGRAANWFKYIWDFNSYEAGTGLGRQEDAFGAGPIVRAPGGTSYDLTVRYYDRGAVDPATLDDGDVVVHPPGAADIPATLVDTGMQEATMTGTARTATYRITPPGGSWDVADNGAYRIELQSGQVLDGEGNPFGAGEIGSFRVALHDPAALNLGAMLAAGDAVAEHTEFDIGTIADLFDGNTSTLVRTPEIDPAVVTLTFDEPQTVTGFRTFLSYAAGDPAHEYTIEAADSVADLESQSGSYTLLVPTTGTPVETWSTVMLDAPHTAKVFRLTDTKLHGDDYVHMNEWQLLGTAGSEDDAPDASLSSLEAVTEGDTAHFLDVTFTDATAVDVASIDNGDIVITTPGGDTIEPAFYDVGNHFNGPERTATFWFIPPGGQWNSDDNGTYTIELKAGAVRDPMYNATTTNQLLGTFSVDILPPLRRPMADLAESNAGDWVAWAENASASSYDDSSRTVAGGASVRFETDGGFDTSATVPPAGAVDWDLAAAGELHFSIYAENPSPYNFQEGPWLRLNGTGGGYFEYRYYQNGNPATPLNDAVGQWKTFTVPLDPPGDPTGWHRTTSGSPDLEHIGSVEFHADTWDAGFTLWFDGVGFDLPPAEIAGRHVFYNGSVLDGNDPAANADDDAAIATDRSALLPGESSSTDSSTGFSAGLTGVMVDVDVISAVPQAGDFSFRMGTTGDPSTWGPAPAPASVDVRPGEGAGDSDRVSLTWDAGEIVAAWLEVTVHGGQAMDLASEDVFYFANMPGDATGDGAVDVEDLGILAGNWKESDIALTPSGGDFNVDGEVDVSDLGILAGNWKDSLPVLELTGSTVALLSSQEDGVVSALLAAPEPEEQAAAAPPDSGDPRTLRATPAEQLRVRPGSRRARRAEVETWTRRRRSIPSVGPSREAGLTDILKDALQPVIATETLLR